MTLSPFSLARAVHLCVDMQRLFAERTDWYTEDLAGILPNVTRIVEARPGSTIFARFLVPASPEAAPGAWAEYYRHWSGIIADCQRDPDLIGLVAPLRALSGGEELSDKATYSMFHDTGLAALLRARGADTVILTGVETDVCVLSTLFAAIEHGFRVVVVEDAVASSSPRAHRAVIGDVLPRMTDHVRLIDTASLLADWSAAP